MENVVGVTETEFFAIERSEKFVEMEEDFVLEEGSAEGLRGVGVDVGADLF